MEEIRTRGTKISRGKGFLLGELMMSGYSLKHLLILDISNDQNCPNRDILLGKRNEAVDFGAYRDCTMAWTHEEPKMQS